VNNRHAWGPATAAVVADDFTNTWNRVCDLLGVAGADVERFVLRDHGCTCRTEEARAMSGVTRLIVLEVKARPCPVHEDGDGSVLVSVGQDSRSRIWGTRQEVLFRWVKIEDPESGELVGHDDLTSLVESGVLAQVGGVT
jgi:hypothetical protein